MSEQTNLEALLATEFFHDIDADHVKRLAKIARPMEFPADSEVFHDYDTAKDMYVIISGRVSLILFAPKFGWRKLMEVGDGQLIGWSPLVGRDHLTDTALTLEPTKVLAIEGERVLALCKADPQFGFDFMHRAAKVMAQRVSALRSQLMEISGFELPAVQIESD